MLNGHELLETIERMLDGTRRERAKLDVELERSSAEMVDGILDGLRHVAKPDAAKDALERLRTMDAGGREALADGLLGIDAGGGDPAMACFVSAALQLYWTRMAALLDANDVRPVEPAGLCPVCGSAPFADTAGRRGEKASSAACSCCSLAMRAGPFGSRQPSRSAKAKNSLDRSPRSTSRRSVPWPKWCT